VRVLKPPQIDISVHCDSVVFEMLMNFAVNNVTPPIDVANVVSLLISSEFLRMEDLVEVCLRYLRAHVADVVKLPIDLGCLSAVIVGRLAAMFTPEELDAVSAG